MTQQSGMLVNGIHLHVIESGPRDGKLLIFLHGFPEFGEAWRHQIDYFAKAGYHVIAPDQRGYNLSEKPKNVSDYTINQLSEDVIGLMDHFKQKKAIVVGHDWGAAVAWWTANQFPERLEKLIILNVPHHDVFKKFLVTHPSQLLRSWYMLFFQLPFLPEKLIRKNGIANLKNTSRPGTFSNEDFKRYQKAWDQPGALTGMLNWYRAGLRHPEKLPSSTINVPTLLIWGKKDAFLKHEMAQPSIDLCPSGKLIFLENVGHWLVHEEPQKISQLIHEFII